MEPLGVARVLPVLFNVHIRVFSLAALRILNAMYMRCLRRLAGECRFGPSVTDIDVRRILKAPSLDCLLTRKRLAYLGRVVRHGPPELRALLARRADRPPLPWVSQLVKDLQCVWRMAALCSALPDPDKDFGPWLQFIVCTPALWSQAYNCIHFVECM